MAIKINKGDNSVPQSEEVTSSKMLEMTEAIRNFCVTLSVPNKTFDVKKAFDQLKQYVSNYDRLLYAEISNYCYHLENAQADNFQGNLNALVEYVYSWNFDNGNSSLEKLGKTDQVELKNKTKRIVIKLYDNVNLACAQMNSLKRSEEELREAVKKEFTPLKEEITKDMSAQLISLVGIFTAIAFLVFGGFDSLMSIFSGLANQSIARLMMASSLWGLIICNGIFILLSCIERIVQKQSLSNLTITSSISHVSNLILITLFFVSSWIHIIDTRNLGGIIVDFANKNKSLIGILGFVVIILFFVIGIILIKRSNAKSKQ